MRSIYEKPLKFFMLLLDFCYWITVKPLEYFVFTLCDILGFIFKRLNIKFDLYCSYPLLENRRCGYCVHVAEVDDSITNAVLEIICVAFDINPESKSKIRLDDSVMDIYNSWYKGSFSNTDDCELERFHAMLEALIGEELSDQYMQNTIFEIICFVDKMRNKKIVEYAELKSVFEQQRFF